MFAIRNTKTGRLLTISILTEVGRNPYCEDYVSMLDITVGDSGYGDSVFVTTDETIARSLVETGKAAAGFDDREMSTLHDLGDLEVVKLAICTSTDAPA